MSAPNKDNDPVIEHSPLERRLSSDGVTVKVLIYRAVALDLRWSLEVVDHEGGSTCWDEMFKTDHDALEAFEDHVKLEGMRSFLEPATRH